MIRFIHCLFFRFLITTISLIIAAHVARSNGIAVKYHINPEQYPHIDERGYVQAFKENGRWVNWWSKGKPGLLGLLGIGLFDTDFSNIPESKAKINEALPVKKPYWLEEGQSKNVDDIRATWIGHASVLTEFDNVTIIADPIFSERAFRYIGPKRFTTPACSVSDLPNTLDAVVISHTHYDHLDTLSVRDLHERYGDQLHWFVPSGLQKWLTKKFKVSSENVHELEWWEEVSMPGKPDVKFILTPSNHWCTRMPWDRNKILWGSWAIIGPKFRYWFAGDTAYANEAFKQIGERYGPFDLAAIPIGAYNPRWYMRYVHVNPEEALLIHEDIKSKKSFGIHWGAFKQTYEYWLEPKEKIVKILTRKNISSEEFQVPNIGETINGK